MSDLPMCVCADVYGSHPPDCPVRIALEAKDAEIERLRKCERHEYDRANAADAEIERLREALDKACETIETRAQVGRSIDYANGFNRGVRCQRLRAKSARAAALNTGEEDDG